MNVREQMTFVEGQLTCPGARITLIVSRFNSFITERLLDGALDVLVRSSVRPQDITVVRAPGAWEIPLVTRSVLARGSVDAVICLGAVIRGSTPHFDYVANEVSKGIAHLSLEFHIPVAFGVLTTDSIEQAVERAGSKMGNKGAEAALAALEMVSLGKQLSGF